jgi:hypothetical protein
MVGYLPQTVDCHCGLDPQSMLDDHSRWFMRHGSRRKAGMTISEAGSESGNQYIQRACGAASCHL